MIKLKRQISDTFSNPIFHFLPLLIILVVDEFIGLKLSVIIAFPLGAIILLYYFFWHGKVFGWHLFFSTFLFLAAVIVALFSSKIVFSIEPTIFGELFCTFFLLGIILLRPKIQKFIASYLEYKLPMLNNTNEMYRIIWSLFYLLLFYVSIVLLLHILPIENAKEYIPLIQYIYAFSTVLIVLYEMLRVYLVRSELIKEEWWPILNENGMIIGNIQNKVSLSDEHKYIHPVVRVIIMDQEMILLQKKKMDDLISPGLWDTAISNHVKVGETVEQCIDRTAKSNCGLDNLKCIFLTNYKHHTPQHKHYVFLFVSCKVMDTHVNFHCAETTKWWTKQQISENIDSGIFTENLIREYDFLQRSGLMEHAKCECKCRLKEVIFNQLYKKRNTELNTES
jgi:ADP-ribose pyrophosphatase YjhB (NUDIX family)